MIEIPTADRTMQVWGWCQTAFRQQGHKLAFPAKTDYYKTYQWRYAQRLSEKFVEWRFNDHTAQAYLNLSAEYIRVRRLLHKGLSAFFQSNMLQVCYDKMDQHQNLEEERLRSIDVAHKFLTSKCGDKPPERVLLLRESFDSFRNIVEWHAASKLPAVYMAVSKACMIAINALEVKLPQERAMLPDKATLFGLRASIVEDTNLRTNIKSILGNDWRALCTR